VHRRTDVLHVLGRRHTCATGVDVLVCLTPAETQRLGPQCCLGHAAELGTPIMILDELDSGVGARLGDAVGRMLRRMAAVSARGAAASQILCVSHLPQASRSWSPFSSLYLYCKFKMCWYCYYEAPPAGKPSGMTGWVGGSVPGVSPCKARSVSLCVHPCMCLADRVSACLNDFF
jgi:hypothetical protein